MENRIFLKRYRLSLGRNGLPVELHRTPAGVTYRGHEVESGREVAIELIPIGSSDRRTLVALREEALLAAQIKHLNIPALQNFGVEGDQIIYVTEYLDGPTAQAWITARGPLSAGAVLRVAIQVVDALGAAGFHRLPHRALNPGNIIFLAGQTAEGEWPAIKLLHWLGPPADLIANDAGEEQLDAAARYASPEQLRGEKVDFPSAVYSLGCTMWFLLTGAVPPSASMGSWEKRSQLGGEKLRSLPKIVRHLLGRMMRFDRAERPQDPVALSAYLQTCLTRVERRKQIKARPAAPALVPAEVPQVKRPFILPIKALALAALFLALATGAALVGSRLWQERTSGDVVNESVIPGNVPFVTRPSFSHLAEYPQPASEATPVAASSATPGEEAALPSEVASSTPPPAVATDQTSETAALQEKPSDRAVAAPVIAEATPPAASDEKLIAAVTPAPEPPTPAEGPKETAPSAAPTDDAETAGLMAETNESASPTAGPEPSAPAATEAAAQTPAIAQADESAPSVAPAPTVAPETETAVASTSQETRLAALSSAPEPPAPAEGPEVTTPAQEQPDENPVAALASGELDESPPGAAEPEPPAPVLAEATSPSPDEEMLTAAVTPTPEPASSAPPAAKHQVASKKSASSAKRSHKRATKRERTRVAHTVKRAKPLPKLRVGSKPVELIGTTPDGKWVLSVQETGRRIIVPPPPGYGDR